MSTIILIIVGIVAAILLLVGLGYLLDRYGVTDKVKSGYDYVQENYPKFRRWLVFGAITVGLIGIVIIVLIIIF
ncbi:MAG: hypothetical protein BMS9Abin02_1714 [Anaerolineae bacterium]|nr:MAG: hypothetical protein BMS9Abin02_1714 [Anaerolineae bacterium]